MITSCGPEAAGPQKQTSPAKESAKRPENREKAKKEEPQKLTDENAREFLAHYAEANLADEAVIQTPLGDIRVKLYKNTPLHRANFIYLARQNYFDDTWFYRVSKDHVVQAGNTDLIETVKKRVQIGEYKVPAEMRPKNYHKRGALAAARSYYQNPEKASNPYEFYIILGKSYSRSQLEGLAEKHDMSFSEDQLRFYSQNAGAPHLDGEHTVFGEVIEGMDVVDKINEVEVDEGEWPLSNIPIEVEIVE